MHVRKLYFIALLLLPAATAHAGTNIPFEGTLNLLQNEINVTMHFEGDSSVEATARKDSENDYRFSVDIERLKTPLFDLLSNIESTVEIVQDDSAMPLTGVHSKLRGKVWSEYSLLDYKPVKELTGTFEIKDQRLYLSEISFADFKCNGYIELVKPFALDVSIDLSGMGMPEFLNLWSANSEYESSGAVTGVIKASGTLDNLLLKGTLESRNGFVQKLNYDSILLNIEGIYPHMKIAQSTVSKSDGVSFTLDGPFNLSDRDQFKKQIKELTIAPLVKDVGAEREWTLKRFEPKDSETIEIKYRHREGDALGIGTTASDEADMFGFERTRKF